MSNSRTATSGTYNTALKKQNSWVKPRRETADGVHGGRCGCPSSSQSVTDLHSEGRPSDCRHWARRCLNHFWVSSSERPASAAMRHSVVGSGCLLTLLKLYSRISTWSSVGPLAVSADMVSARQFASSCLRRGPHQGGLAAHHAPLPKQ